VVHYLVDWLKFRNALKTTDVTSVKVEDNWVIANFGDYLRIAILPHLLPPDYPGQVHFKGTDKLMVQHSVASHDQPRNWHTVCIVEGWTDGPYCEPDKAVVSFRDPVHCTQKGVAELYMKAFRYLHLHYSSPWKDRGILRKDIGYAFLSASNGKDNLGISLLEKGELAEKSC
jgi:hypothetical protein